MCIEAGILFVISLIVFMMAGDIDLVIFSLCGAVWCFYCACDEKKKKKTGGNKNNSNFTHHKMSDDDKWLEENSWVWSDPNYNGKRNRRK